MNKHVYEFPNAQSQLFTPVLKYPHVKKIVAET